MKIDLHCHSLFSDGDYSLDELFTFAENSGLTHLAITDHDNVASFNFKNNSYVKHIYGIELSTEFNGKSVHVLGYFNSKDSLTNEFLEIIDKIKEYRVSRMHHYVYNLNKHYKLNLDMNEITSEVKVITRSHLAKIISEKNSISLDDAFSLYLKPDNIAYVPSSFLNTSEAITLLRNSGAIVGLAHPCLLKQSTLETLLEAYDFDCIEVLHPQNKKGDYDNFIKIAKDNNLIKTAGSDFHRLNDKKHADVGTCFIEGIDAQIFIEKLKEKRV